MSEPATVPVGDATLRRHVQPLIDDFRRRWRDSGGASPQIEEYLAGCEELEKSVTLYHLLAAELDLRRGDGGRAEQSEYRARFPAHLSVVDAVFQDLETLSFQQPAADTSSRQRGAAGAADGDRPRPAREGPAVAEGLGTLGDYDLLDVIGRGGMGVVYRAIQRPLSRVVAVKMVRAGAAAGPEELARFRIEAEAAAALDHPQIVPVFDIGEHDGQPYFSMGYVDGDSLARYTATSPLAEGRSAELVRKLAEGIEYAHQHGILHRDLKPSNILIDRAGEPRITDFGLAKQLAGTEGHTLSGQILGTPSYMAPEQAAGDSARIGPTADVYALGAILYFLLAGRPPFRAPTPVATLAQVREQDPVPPRKWNSWVSRDLETICLKCLEKSPARRYPSARALADDLARYERGEPVCARRTAAWERAAKWARRRPAVAALSAAVAATVVLAATVLAWYQVRLWQRTDDLQQALGQARLQERAAREARDLAARNADLAAQGHGLALDVLQATAVEVSEQLRDTPRTLQLRKQLLEQALADLDRLPRLAATAARLDRTQAIAATRLGEVHLRLGQTAQARAAFQEAIEILGHLYDNAGERPQAGPALALVHERLGGLYFHYEHDLTQAGEHYERAREIREQQLDGAADPAAARRDLAVVYEQLGQVALRGGDVSQSQDLFWRCFEIRSHLARETNSPDSQRDVSVALERLGQVCLELREVDRAREYFERALAISESLAETDPGRETRQDLSVLYSLLGKIHLGAGDPLAARQEFDKSLHIRQELAAADPDDIPARRDVAIAFENLGNAALAAGELPAAGDAFRQALQIRQGLVLLDGDNLEFKRDLSISHETLARTYQRQRDFDAACGQLQQSKTLRQELHERQPDDAQLQRDLAVTHNLLAAARLEQGNPQAAREHYQAALDLCQSLARRTGGDRAHLEVVTNWIGLGNCHEAQQRFGEALDAYQAAQKSANEVQHLDSGLKRFLEQRIEACRKAVAPRPIE